MSENNNSPEEFVSEFDSATPRANIFQLLKDLDCAKDDQRVVLLKSIALETLHCTDADILLRVAHVLAENEDVTGSQGIKALKCIFMISPASRYPIVQNILKLRSNDLILHTLKQLGQLQHAEHGQCAEMNQFVAGLCGQDLEYYSKNRAILDRFLLDDVELEKEDSSVLPEPEMRADFELRSGVFDENFELSRYLPGLSERVLAFFDDESEPKLVQNMKVLADEVFPFTAKDEQLYGEFEADIVNQIAVRCIEKLSSVQSLAARSAIADVFALLTLFSGTHIKHEILTECAVTMAKVQLEQCVRREVMECIAFRDIRLALDVFRGDVEAECAIRDMLAANFATAEIELESGYAKATKQLLCDMGREYQPFMEQEYLVFASASQAPVCFFADFIDAMVHNKSVEALLQSRCLDEMQSKFFAVIHATELQASEVPNYLDCAHIDVLLHDLRENKRCVIEYFESRFPEAQLDILNVLYVCLQQGDETLLSAFYASKLLRSMKDNIMLYQAKQRNHITCMHVLRTFMKTKSFQTYQFQKQLDIISKYFSNAWLIFAQILFDMPSSTEVEFALLNAFFAVLFSLTGCDTLIFLSKDKITASTEVPLLLLYAVYYLKTTFLPKHQIELLSAYSVQGKYTFSSDIEPGLLVKVLLDQNDSFTSEYSKYSKVMVGFRSETRQFSFVQSVLDELSTEIDTKSGARSPNPDLIEKESQQLNYFLERKEGETPIELLIETYSQVHTTRDKLQLLEQFLELQDSETEARIDENVVEFCASLLTTERETQLVDKVLDLTLYFLNNAAGNKNQLGRAIIAELFTHLSASTKAIRFKSVECINELLNIKELLSQQLNVRENVFASALLASLEDQKTTASTLQWLNQYFAPNVSDCSVPANEFVKKVNRELTRLITNKAFCEAALDMERFISEHFIMSLSCANSPMPSRPSTPIQMKSRAATPNQRDIKAMPALEPREAREKAVQNTMQEAFLNRASTINVFEEQEKPILQRFLHDIDPKLSLDNLESAFTCMITGFERYKYVTDVLLLHLANTRICEEHIAFELLKTVNLVTKSELGQNRYLGRLMLIALFCVLPDRSLESQILDAIEQLEVFADEQFIVFGLETYTENTEIAMLYNLAEEMLDSPELCQVLLLHLANRDINDLSVRTRVVDAAREKLQLGSRNDVLDRFGEEYCDQICKLLFNQANVFDLYPDLKMLDSEVSLVFNELGSQIASEMQFSEQPLQGSEPPREEKSEFEEEIMLLAKANLYGEQLQDGVKKLYHIAERSDAIPQSPVIFAALPGLLDKIVLFQLLDQFEIAIILQKTRLAHQFDGSPELFSLALKAYENYPMLFAYIASQLCNCDAQCVLRILYDLATSKHVTPEILTASKILLIQLAAREKAQYHKSEMMDDINDSLRAANALAQESQRNSESAVLDMLKTYCSELNSLCVSALPVLSSCVELK